MRKLLRWWALVGFGIVIIVVIVFSKTIGTKTVSDIDPQKLFQEYVCDPIPDGVVDIRSDVRESMASTSILVEFNVTDKDVFGGIVKAGGLKLKEGDSKSKVDVPRNRILFYQKEYRGYEIVEIRLDFNSLSGTAYYGGG